MTIDPNQLYSVATIVENRWIRSRRWTSSSDYLYRLIRKKKLQAKNWSANPRKPSYMVKGSALLAYIKRYYV